jgi:hypothetical protein
MTKRFVNLTPHKVTEIVSGVTFDPSGSVARVDMTQKVLEEVALKEGNRPLTIYKTVYGEVQNLPKPSEDTIYIVSAPVINALLEKGIRRTDVVAPYQIQRDSGGTPRGCNGFRVNG